MGFRVRHAVLSLALTACVAGAGLPALVAAQDATPMASAEAMGPPPPAYATVIASGLNNPRGLFVDADGNIWVAESGLGGDGPCATGPEGNEECMGMTGAVAKIAPDGTMERVLEGLASRAEKGGAAATGPNDVAVSENKIYVLFGYGGDPATRVDLGTENELGWLKVDDGSGLKPVVDVAAYETTANPDGAALDSNPYSLLPAAEGAIVVSDAGGNALLNVTAAGEISTLAVLPGLEAPLPNFDPATPGAATPEPQIIPVNAVPTGISANPDGSIVVGELTGFPFPIGGASVFTVPADGGDPAPFAEGFTNIIDTAVGPDGSTYVLEMLTGSLLNANPEDPATMLGQLTRISLDGTRTVIANEGLVLPTGLAVGADGSIYVATFGIVPGMGQIWQIAPPA
ncbi:MAG: ScyD/ScyE family protein [Thermomicrobiales bacterium]